MKKKAVVLFSLFFVCIFVVTGCNPLNNADTTVDTWEDTLAEWKMMQPKEIEEHIILEVSETYRIDATIRLSDELESYEVDTVKLTRHRYEDVEDVLREWMDYCKVEISAEIEVLESGEYFENEIPIYYVINEFGVDNSWWMVTRSNGAMMGSTFSNMYGLWRVDSIHDRQLIGNAHYETVRDAEPFISETSVEEMKQSLENIFDVDFLEEYEAYSYNVEALQEAATYEKEYTYAQDDRYEDTDFEVTEADEGMVLYFYQGYEGIPIFYDEPSFDVTKAEYLVSNYCEVILSKEGMEGLNLVNPYDVVGVNESVEILSFGELIEKHINDRRGVDTTVVNVGLYYLPIYTGEDFYFVTKPIWCIQVEEENMSGIPIRNTVIYDAVTGDEISWN